MSTDFFQAVPYADARKVDCPRERGVRVFCVQWGDAWAVQVRAPMRLASGAEGRDFIVAHANLDKAGMLALRDAIDAILVETGEGLGSDS